MLQGLGLKSIGLALAALMVAVPFVAGPVQADDADNTLVVSSFGGALDAGYKAVFKKFEEDNHATIQWVPGSATEGLAKALATRNAPQYDIIMVEDVTYVSGLKQGLWAKVDPAVVTNYADLYDAARQPGDSGVAIGTLSEGIFYRADEFAKRGWPVPTTWSDLLRPEFCGVSGISHPNSSDGMRTLLLLAGGDSSKVDGIIDSIAQQKKCFPTLDPVAAQLEEKIRLGQYLVGTQNSIHSIPLMKAGFPIKFVVPSTGTIAAYSIAAPVKGGPHAALAQKFLNWFIDPGVQKQLMENLAYAPTNKNVLVPPELRDEGILDAEAMKHLIPVDAAEVSGLQREWARRVDRAWDE